MYPSEVVYWLLRGVSPLLDRIKSNILYVLEIAYCFYLSRYTSPLVDVCRWLTCSRWQRPMATLSRTIDMHERLLLFWIEVVVMFSLRLHSHFWRRKRRRGPRVVQLQVEL